ncbi:hypothetical protein Daus18300_007984 [Diaporthe australafricana]|uniref:Uncharacterized protein n=1 Tax=Diaporthe australafricana TaxID=127596 RepID=A0ABR3WKF7_9PEZI
MSSPRQMLSALAAAAGVHAAMGPAFSTGPTADDTFIRESWATLVLPSAPSDNSGDLSLWVGMGTSNGDLVQSIAENWSSDDWSVYAYTLMSTIDSTQMPVQDEGSTAEADAHVTFHYKYDDNSGNYTQTVLVNGDVVSTLSTSDGKAEGWGSAVECAAEDCGTVAAHTWINCSIILDSADTAYSDTLALGTDVEGSMSSEDGITWTIGTISIPGWSFGSESVVESTSTSSSASSASSSASYGSSSGSPSYGASGASPSGTSSGASSSDSDDTPASQPSGSFGAGSYGGESSGASPTSGGSGGSGSEASGARPTGSWGSWGARPPGSFGGSSFGSSSSSASSTDDASDASPSSTSSRFGGTSGDYSGGWWRSRIMRHRQ